MACAPVPYRLHVRPKLDSGGRMFAIVVHLAMFAFVKHSPVTVHFEAGHCKRYGAGAQAIAHRQSKLQDFGAVGILESKNGLLEVTMAA